MKSWMFLYTAMIKPSPLSVPFHKNIEVNQSVVGSYFWV